MDYLDKNGLSYFWGKIKEKFSYTTTEQKIGTWTNGKPLYRKVYGIVIPGSTGNWSNISNVLPSNTVLRKYHAFIEDRSGITNLNYYEDSTNYFLIKMREDKLYYKASSNFTNTSLSVILEYTKTTD